MSLVAVVIHIHGEGPSVFNAAERYAETIWQRHFPDQDAPPIWIHRFIFPSRDDDPFGVVTFPVGGRHQLDALVRQIPITELELTTLVGSRWTPIARPAFGLPGGLATVLSVGPPFCTSPP